MADDRPGLTEVLERAESAQEKGERLEKDVVKVMTERCCGWIENTLSERMVRRLTEEVGPKQFREGILDQQTMTRILCGLPIATEVDEALEESVDRLLLGVTGKVVQKRFGGGHTERDWQEAHDEVRREISGMVAAATAYWLLREAVPVEGSVMKILAQVSEDMGGADLVVVEDPSDRESARIYIQVKGRAGLMEHVVFVPVVDDRGVPGAVRVEVWKGHGDEMEVVQEEIMDADAARRIVELAKARGIDPRECYCMAVKVNLGANRRGIMAKTDMEASVRQLRGAMADHGAFMHGVLE